jgi:hypothetical protein
MTLVGAGTLLRLPWTGDDLLKLPPPTSRPESWRSRLVSSALTEHCSLWLGGDPETIGGSRILRCRRRTATISMFTGDSAPQLRARNGHLRAGLRRRLEGARPAIDDWPRA